VILTPERVEKSKAWDLNLYEVLNRVFKTYSPELTNFAIYGMALYSSAIILKWKVDSLLLGDQRSRSRIERVERPGELYTKLEMPVRCGGFSTSIEDLLGALQRVLLWPSRPRSPAVVTPLDSVVLERRVADEFPEEIEALRRELEGMLGGDCEVLFSDVAVKLDKTWIVKRFLLLLILATQGYVELENVGDDIAIRRGSA